jgi:mRNA interferase MazF
MKSIKRGHIWWANLNPEAGTEAGKIRPVLIVQTDLLNDAGHPSTIICPLTTQLAKKASILRVAVDKGVGGVTENSQIMIDQLRAIDNKRLSSHIGILPTDILISVNKSLKIILDL